MQPMSRHIAHRWSPLYRAATAMAWGMSAVWISPAPRARVTGPVRALLQDTTTAAGAVEWIARVLPQYGTFDYTVSTNLPIAQSGAIVDSVRPYPCALSWRITRKSKNTSSVDDSVGFALLNRAAISVTKLEHTTVSVAGTSVQITYAPGFWQVTAPTTGAVRAVVVRDPTTGQERTRLAALALNVQREDQAKSFAKVLEVAIRRCQASASP